MASSSNDPESRPESGGTASTDPTAAKKRWRRRARDERRDLTFDHDACCRVLADFLQRSVPPDRVVVVYQALPDEVDLDGLVDSHEHPERRFAVTRTPDDGFELTVHPHGGPTERHDYGYDQPTIDAPRVADHEIGAVLVPGLAFDRFGGRLGRGKGYYDRFLGRLGPDALRIGITGGYVVAEQLPTDRYDIMMTHLADDVGVVEIG